MQIYDEQISNHYKIIQWKTIYNRVPSRSLRILSLELLQIRKMEDVQICGFWKGGGISKPDRRAFWGSLKLHERTCMQALLASECHPESIKGDFQFLAKKLPLNDSRQFSESIWKFIQILFFFLSIASRRAIWEMKKSVWHHCPISALACIALVLSAL